MPSFGGFTGTSADSPDGSLLQYALSAALMAAAFIFAVLYRRRPRKR